MVVSGPWPQMTGIEPGKAKSFSRMEARIASVSPPLRSVRPMERRKSVSPEKRSGSSPSSAKQVRGLLRKRFVELPVVGVKADGSLGDLGDLPRAGDVIEMRVRVEKGDGPHLRGSQDGENPLGLVAGIDDDGLSRRFVHHDRAVALQRTDGERLDECGHVQRSDRGLRTKD